MILSAQSIRERTGMIDPFTERQQYCGMSCGLSVAGYDVRVEFGFGDSLRLAPGSFRLASTMEWFNMPNDILGEVKDKSTWARRGLTVQNTVIEPGWRGHLTLELTNHGDRDITLLYGHPIAQIIFSQVDRPVEIPYDGKYQDQPRGPQGAKFE